MRHNLLSSLPFLFVASWLQAQTTPARPVFNTFGQSTPTAVTQTKQGNGTHASGVLQQAQTNAHTAMGYSKPAVPPSNTAEFHAWNQQQQKQHTQRQANSQMQKLYALLNKASAGEPAAQNYWQAPGFAQAEQPYRQALAALQQQLQGKAPLSVKNAYYEIEKAWGNTLLNKKELDKSMAQSAGFILQWLQEKGQDITDNLALHYGIQKFMADTLVLKNTGMGDVPALLPAVHYPFRYDFKDYKAERDYRSYHATKALATGYGQCHTLPLVYAMLAEELGATFYLCHAPQHDFVKYPDNAGNMHNYEPTSHWNISDQWYKDHLYVSAQAERSGIYLNPLNKQQIVAGAVLDLAESYRKKLGVADGGFITACANMAMPYFKNGEANLYGWLLRYDLIAVKLNRALQQHNATTPEEIAQIPEAAELVQQLKALNQKLEQLGYTETPPQAYEQMLQEHSAKAKKQHVNTFEKRDMFRQSQKP